MKRYGILDRYETPASLREMSYPVLNELCASLREFIVDHVSQTGGHLASNLGIVELSVALERTFDSSRDRIIYDVGHQSYVHKILTGRRDTFDTLRTFGGLSGFMKPSESPCDPCITGHASSSVSVALGMAHARTLRGQKYHVIAVIGDGALTGGMAYEAMNSAGVSGEPLIAVLNDNNMSIDRNVGALSRHLAKLRISPRYMRTKERTKRVIGFFPFGKAIIRRISRFKSVFKGLILPSSLFEQMGFAYLGPVDGHDIKAVCEHLAVARKMKKPVLVHVMTQKGRGYAPAEEHPDAFHGVSKFDPSDSVLQAPEGDSFSVVFGRILSELAEKDGRICAVTAAMPSGTGLSGFARAYPDRFFDVGIAEEHAVAMTAGMAKQGLKPVCAIYSTFLQRAYDQLIHDVAIDGTIAAVFAVDRAGIVGADGATHNGVFDVAYLRTIPGMTVLCPANYAEMKSMMTRALYHMDGAVAIRYPRGGEGAFRTDTSQTRFAFLQQGSDVLLVAYGMLINEALQAAQLLSAQGLSVGVCKLNEISGPIPQEILDAVHAVRLTAVIEDVVQTGSISEALGAMQTAGRLLAINTGDRFLPHGTVKELYEFCGIDAMSIARGVQEAVN